MFGIVGTLVFYIFLCAIDNGYASYSHTRMVKKIWIFYDLLDLLDLLLIGKSFNKFNFYNF